MRVDTFATILAAAFAAVGSSRAELAITTDSILPDGEVGQEYTLSFEASGGIAPYTWSVSESEPEIPTFGESSSFTETGTAQDWRDDDECWELVLPFKFPYFGSTFEAVKVNSNGTLSFGDGFFDDSSYDDARFLETPMIALLWTDLTTDEIGCDVFVSSTESSVTIRWKAEYYDGGSVNAAATLHADGRIVLAYGDGNADGGFVGFSAGDGETSFTVEEPEGGWGGARDVSFSAPDSGSPDWLSLSEDGILYGTPSVAGTYSLRVSAVSADGQTALKTFSIDVVAGPLTIVTDSTLPIAWLEDGVPGWYRLELEATGGEEPYTWEIVDSTDWPEWLLWEDRFSDYGYLSVYGYPDWGDIGTYAFVLRVTDVAGTSVEKSFSLVVAENPNPAPVIDESSPEAAYTIVVQPGQSQTFSVEAHDPKGDELSYVWWTEDDDGERVQAGSAPSWTFVAAQSDLGQTWKVECEVSDGENTVTSYWTLSVRIPKTVYVDAASTAVVPDGLTPETAFQTLSDASGIAEAGDIVVVASGTYEDDFAYFSGVGLRSSGDAFDTILDGAAPSGIRSIEGFTIRNVSGHMWASGDAVMDRCIIENCYAYGDGFLYGWEIRNSLIVGNTSGYGPVLEGSILYNCTIVENRSEELSEWEDEEAGAALSSSCEAYNCIVWNNRGPDGNVRNCDRWIDEESGEACWTPLFNCCVNEWGNDVSNHLVLSDPLFVDAAGGDYRLRSGSPCVDAGYNGWKRGEADLAGEMRSRGLCVDLGCHESAGRADRTATVFTPVPVPFSWLDAHGTMLAEAGGEYETFAASAARNGRPVWECYVADLDPEDAGSEFLATIEMEAGKPAVTVAGGQSPNRVYTVQGARTLGGAWDDLDDGVDCDASGYRFFRVKVSLPEND